MVVGIFNFHDKRRMHADMKPILRIRELIFFFLVLIRIKEIKNFRKSQNFLHRLKNYSSLKYSRTTSIMFVCT